MKVEDMPWRSYMWACCKSVIYGAGPVVAVAWLARCSA